MKYENLEKVKEICRDIDYLESTLNEMTEEDDKFVLLRGVRGFEIKIPSDSCKHAFLNELANEFIEKIKNSLHTEIRLLKIELEKL